MEDGDKSNEMDQDAKYPTSTLRRGPSRKAKIPMSYREMVGRNDNRQKDTDTAILATMDPYNSSKFSFSSASSYHVRDTFISEDGTIEGMHTCALIKKVQIHGVDNPVNKDILRQSSTDKVAWEDTMIK